MCQMKECAKNAGKFVAGQLKTACVTIDDLGKSGALEKAGGGLSVNWLKKLTAGNVAKLSARQVIGLRRLFDTPIDTIIGLAYMSPDYAAKQAGIIRIARNMGTTYKKALWRKLCENMSCPPEIVSRIIKFSSWAVKEHAGNINTPAEEVRKQLMQTFSLPVLIRFKWGMHTNIDDILGLGEYSPEAEYLATKDIKPDEPEGEDYNDERTEEDRQRKRDHDKEIIAEFNAHRENNANTITHFQPASSREAI